jgi:tight adherence protein B
MAAFVVVFAALGAAAVALPSWARARRIRARLAAESPTGSPSQGHVHRRPPAPVPVLLAGGAGAATTAAMVGPVALAVLAAVALVGPVGLRRRRRFAARLRRSAQLPQALERLAGALRSGSSLPIALGEAGRATSDPLGPELVGMANEAAQGRPMAAVLDRWTQDHDDRDTRLAATALALSTAVGATPARAVDGVAATVRERLDLAAERRALGSQARASAIVLSIAPAAFAVVLGASDGAAARFLLRTPSGWLCLAIGLGLDAGGAWWMARLTRGASP